MSGVAMGTKMGPSYACLFVRHFEHTLLQQYKKQVPEIYRSYMDDGTCTTSMKYNQLQDCISFVQNFHPAVTFTYEISEESILDINVSSTQGQLTSVLCKVP